MNGLWSIWTRRAAASKAGRKPKNSKISLSDEGFLIETLMDHMPDHIYFKDRESRFLRINKAMALRFGLKDPLDAVGKTDFDFFTAEHAQQAFDDEQQILRTGQPMVDREEKETWPDGSVSWVSTTRSEERRGGKE